MDHSGYRKKMHFRVYCEIAGEGIEDYEALAKNQRISNQTSVWIKIEAGKL